MSCGKYAASSSSENISPSSASELDGAAVDFSGEESNLAAYQYECVCCVFVCVCVYMCMCAKEKASCKYSTTKIFT